MHGQARALFAVVMFTLFCGPLFASGTSALAQGDSIRLSGQVISSNDLEPVGYAVVWARVEGRIIASGLTDENGEYELMVPAAEIHTLDFDLAVRYLGEEVVAVGLNKNSPGVDFRINDFYELESQYILGWLELRDPGPCGGPGPECVIGPRKKDPRSIACGARMMRGTEKPALYRPMDEWLMMNHSEINHTGRW